MYTKFYSVEYFFVRNILFFKKSFLISIKSIQLLHYYVYNLYRIIT